MALIRDMWDWITDRIRSILGIALVATALSGLLYWLINSDLQYAKGCKEAGGRIVAIRNTDICVDREWKVVFP